MFKWISVFVVVVMLMAWAGVAMGQDQTPPPGPLPEYREGEQTPVVVVEDGAVQDWIILALAVVAVLGVAGAIYLGHQRGFDYPAEVKDVLGSLLQFIQIQTAKTPSKLDDQLAKFAVDAWNDPRSFLVKIPDDVDPAKVTEDLGKVLAELYARYKLPSA